MYIKVLVSLMALLAFMFVYNISTTNNMTTTNNTTEYAASETTDIKPSYYENHTTVYNPIRNDIPLIVNGKELCIMVFNDRSKDHEIPLLLISRELGAEVEWKDSCCVVISYDEVSTELDISKNDFGLLFPPGGIGIRKVENGEIYLEYATLRGIVTGVLKAEIYDYGDSLKIWRS